LDTVTILFWVFFSATLVALASALVTGLRRRRRLHLRLAPAALVLLVIAIVFAEQMGRTREFPPHEMSIHLMFAKSAAALVIPVVLSGLWLWRRGRGRRLHLICVVVFLLTTVTAASTGVWVYSLSTPG